MFWDRLNDLCKQKKIKPNTVTKELGLSNATATKWKSGGIPNGETLTKIADYFGVAVDYLLGRTDNPNPPKPRLPDELQALLDKQEHEHVLYTLSAGGRNQQMVILSDEEYDWLQATLKTYREQKEKSENQEK